MKRFLFLFGILALASLACGPQFVTPCDGCIDMVQPNGWNASRDSQYAGGVNLPNSQANLNNAQAEAALLEAYKSENNTDTKTGFLFGSVGMFLCMTVLFFLGGGYVFVSSIEYFAKRKVHAEDTAASTDIVTYKRVGNRFERS